jgi:hypothetical protein
MTEEEPAMRTQSWYGRGAVYLNGQQVADIRYHMTIVNSGEEAGELHGTIEVSDPTAFQSIAVAEGLVLQLTAHQKQLRFTAVETERPHAYTVVPRDQLSDL